MSKKKAFEVKVIFAAAVFLLVLITIQVVSSVWEKDAEAENTKFVVTAEETVSAE